MSVVKKTVKFVEEKEMNKQKKMQRSKERLGKYESADDTKVIEDPPQHETQKEFEESFALYKRTCNPKDPLYQDHSHPIKEISQVKELSLEELVEPSAHYKEGEGEGWESDCDGWFD